MVTEERLVGRQELLDDRVVHFLALVVPHLFVATEMREGVIRLADLVVGAHHRIAGEDRHSDVIRVLGAHRPRSGRRSAGDSGHAVSVEIEPRDG